MSSIPLPALDLRPPQQPDIMGDVSKMLALKSMMGQQQMQQQEMQQRQQQIADQKATTQAMKSIDPTQDKYKENPQQYYSDAAQSVLANGGSATAAQGLQQHGLTVQKTVSDIHAQDAATGSKNLETFIKKQGTVGDQLAGADGIPDDQLKNWSLSKIQDLAQNGLMDAPSAQHLAQGIQQSNDPKALRDQIKVFANTAIGAKAVAENQKTLAETDKDVSQGAQADAETEKIKQQVSYGPSGEAADSKYRQIIQNQAMGQQPSTADAAFVKAYKNQKTLVPTANFNLQNAGAGGSNGQPSALAQAIANGSMKWNDAISARTPMSVKTQMLSEVKALNPNFNSGDFDVEQGVKKMATSGTVGQQLLAIGTAREHMKTFGALADALDNGNVQVLNKIGNSLGVQFGSDKATNLQIAAQAFGGEVGRAFDGAGVIGKEREEAQSHFADQLSKGQFKGAIQTVDSLLAGKQKSAHDWFDQGVHAKPDFGNNPATTDQSSDPFAAFGGKKR